MSQALYQLDPIFVTICYSIIGVIFGTIIGTATLVLAVEGFVEFWSAWRFKRRKARPCPPMSAPQSHFVSVPYSLLERRRLYSGMSEALET